MEKLQIILTIIGLITLSVAYYYHKTTLDE